MAPQSNLYFVWKTFQNGKNPKKVLLLFRIFLNITKDLISLLLFIDYKKINENTIIWQICNKTLTNLKKTANSKFYYVKPNIPKGLWFYYVKPKSSMCCLTAHRKNPYSLQDKGCGFTYSNQRRDTLYAFKIFDLVALT